MKITPETLKLYAVTDRRWLKNQTLAEQIEQALKGGVTCVQLREKNADTDFFLKEAIQIKKICQKYQVPLLINDNIEVALKADADGVHVGQNDMPVQEVRKLLGENKIIGVTAKTVEQALNAQNGGADYLGSGAIFETLTKTDTYQIDYKIFTEICQTVKIPVVAIGGIKQENMLQLKGLGMAGIALTSAIFASETIEQTCQELKALAEQVTESFKNNL